MQTLTKWLSVIAPLLWTCAVYAETKKYGDWYVDLESTYAEAYTTNSSGSTLGMYCLKSSQECLYYLSSGDTCTVDTRTVALINADTGAAMAGLLCIQLESKRHINLFTNFDEIDSTLRGNKLIGLALPMKDGQFKVVRFSLNGSNQATTEAASFISSGAASDTYL